MSKSTKICSTAELVPGAAPGQVGVIQVNAVVPDTLSPGQNAVVLVVGTVSSPAITVWVK